MGLSALRPGIGFRYTHDMHKPATSVTIEGDQFFINGQPTYPGRVWQGRKIEGLLLNARMVQGIFDDMNPQTRTRWDYPDGPWDAERNTREFIEAMPVWREHGLISFDINLQGGSPQGYSREQPWHNSAIRPDGSLDPGYMGRLGRVLDQADRLGMIPMLGIFYFGQDERLLDEAAVRRAVIDTVDWLIHREDRHVLIEIANEIDITDKWEHAILSPARCVELIELVRERGSGRFPVSISYSGNGLPSESIIASSDYVLLHGNGVPGQDRIREMVDEVRASSGYRGQPIVFNEDDHFDFDQPDNHFLAALDRYAGWGYFDYRMAGEGYDEGYQSVPANWQISSVRKRGFFDLLARVTGGHGD